MMARLITLIRKHSVIFCLYALLCFLLLYCGINLWELFGPLDPNFPLHALAGLDLSDGGSGFVNTRLEFPDGLIHIWQVPTVHNF